MYEIMHDIFADKTGGEVFTCFSIWHIAFIVIVLGVITALLALYRNKSPENRVKAITRVIDIAFALYVLDFFIMPFAYGEIDVEKLPFHACTLTCVLSFLSRHNSFLGRFKLQFTLVGLASNLIYVIYPAGVMWYAVHPLSYRAVQTLGFHGIMTVYGVLALALEDDVRIRWRSMYKEFILLCIMAVWATVGNTLYSGEAGNYSRNFNWFFMKSDPFGMFPSELAPLITIAAFIVADAVIYLVYFAIRRLTENKKADG